MNGVNLIPLSRRRARARRVQLRVWSAAVLVCGLLLAGAYAGLCSTWQTGTGDLTADAEKLDKEVAAIERLDKLAQTKIREAKAAAAAAREISDQPDWGVLLTFVADKLGPEAVLDSFRIEPPKPAAAAPTPAKGAPAKPAAPATQAGRCTLVLTGVAKSQDAASSVAIGLKQTELFAGVTLVETRRTGFMGSAAVAFRIDCAIAHAGGAE